MKRLFETPEHFEEAADRYFDHCNETGEPITWTGLCLHVGAASRESLEPYKKGEYDKDGVNFSDSVKNALLRVENSYEKKLASGGSAGDIFALKNFGWTDKREVSTEVNGTVQHEHSMTDSMAMMLSDIYKDA